MTEAIFGLIGVLIGSGISWFQTYWTTKQTEIKNAKYLAIRVVSVLDRYVVDCADVVKDDGLSCGQRDSHGYLSPQVNSPGPPIFPQDVDWRSIDQDLMFKLLSLPSEVDAADRMIEFSTNIASPPDFEEWFDERRYFYSQFGLAAFTLSEELSKRYGIKKKVYNDWDPAADLQREFDTAKVSRIKRIERSKRFVKRHLERSPDK